MKSAQTFSIPNRLNLIIFFIASPLAIAFLKLASLAQSLPLTIMFAIFFGFVNCTLFFLMHEAVHGMLHTNRKVNDILGAFAGAFFPMSFQMQRIYHLGHHYRNRTKAELFDYYEKNDNRLFRFIEYNAIVNGFFWFTTSFSSFLYLLFPQLFRETTWKKSLISNPRVEAMVQGFNGNENGSRIRLELLFALLFQMSIIRTFDLSFTRWIICYWIYGMIWGALQFVFHAGAPRDIKNGAYNLKVNPLIHFILLQFPYHLVHHQNPRLPWIYLGNNISDKKNLPKLFPRYLKMWLGPNPIQGTEAPPIDSDLNREIRSTL
ncbi:MAG: fatty acid desaturase family protein [Pseudobdellovibrionaceae bacterium]